jgi:hypothetical protein
VTLKTAPYHLGTGATGAGNSIFSSNLDGTPGSADLQRNTTTYGAPTNAGGTAATVSITVTGTHRVLVTLTTNCQNTSNDSGCFMSFAASGGLTQSGSDDFAVGDGRSPGTGSRNLASSASYLVTVSGDTTFTAQYKAPNNTAVFHTSNIIVQVY